jgi:uncharacterized protein (TIGR03084 family)
VRHLAVSEKAACVALAGHGADLFAGGSTRIGDVGADVLGAWRAARTNALAQFAPLDDHDRIFWGAGPMSARSFADARLMETWAHGLDCFAALNVEPVDTARLKRIAGLGWRALPYAFRVAGVAPTGDPRSVALDLTGPEGEQWWLGPAQSSDVVRGTASDWCRVATRRLAVQSTSLSATSPLAAAALGVARAYLAD